MIAAYKSDGFKLSNQIPLTRLQSNSELGEGIFWNSAEDNLQTATISKKNILKSASFDVMQTVFFAFTCKFGLVL